VNCSRDAALRRSTHQLRLTLGCHRRRARPPRRHAARRHRCHDQHGTDHASDAQVHRARPVQRAAHGQAHAAGADEPEAETGNGERAAFEHDLPEDPPCPSRSRRRSSPPRNRSANRSFTIATRTPRAWSSTVSDRPRAKRTPNVSKNPAVTARNITRPRRVIGCPTGDAELHGVDAEQRQPRADVGARDARDGLQPIDQRAVERLDPRGQAKILPEGSKHRRQPNRRPLDRGGRCSQPAACCCGTVRRRGESTNSIPLVPPFNVRVTAKRLHQGMRQSDNARYRRAIGSERRGMSALAFDSALHGVQRSD
jgi:hypothetical protein